MATTSGEGTPFTSLMSVFFTRTIWITTLVAETWVPSDSWWGITPCHRSQAFLDELHRQYTSEYWENGRCTSATDRAFEGRPSEYVNTGSGANRPSMLTAWYRPWVLVYRSCGAVRAGSRR